MRRHKPKARVNIRVDDDLVHWTKAFAKKHDTSMTELIVRGLEDLRRRHSAAPPKVEQF